MRTPRTSSDIFSIYRVLFCPSMAGLYPPEGVFQWEGKVSLLKWPHFLSIGMECNYQIFSKTTHVLVSYTGDT